LTATMEEVKRLSPPAGERMYLFQGVPLPVPR
jgi:hypothetical protein